MKSRAFTVTTTATEIIAAEPSTRHAQIHVLGANIVYIGGSDVTTSNGLPTEKNAEPMELVIPAGETLWAIVPSSTESVRVLTQGD